MIFYKQERIGQYGKPFILYKFRTMVKEADRIGGPSTKATDGRITRVGRILRRFKLDELPQIYNVLRGEMALVGPRPTVREVIDTLDAETREAILSVKPGITGLGTLWDNNEEQLIEVYSRSYPPGSNPDPHQVFMEKIYPQIIQLEWVYVKHKNWLLDLWIIWQTILKLLRLQD